MTHNPNFDVLEILAEMPVFQGLSAERLSEIAQCCHIHTMDKGEFVFREGEQPRAFYHLISGQIKLAVSSPEGDEKVLAILYPVQSFGEPELFSIRPYASYAETVMPTVVLHIGKEAILKQVERDPQFALRMLQTLSNRHADLERDAAARRLQNCSARVMDYLLELAGTDLDTSGSTTLELTASKQLIAARLDLTPETLSRTLRSLSEAGMISVCGRHVTLNRPVTSARTAAAIAGRSMAAARTRPAMRLAA
jgi:CRP-like cAMP-binding protein